MPEVSSKIQDALQRLIRVGTQAQTRATPSPEVGGPLPPAKDWLLRTVAEMEPVRLTDLAAELHVDRSTISPQVRQLEDAGLVTRRQEADDRRVWDLRTTPQGKNVLERTAAARTAMLEQVLAAWPDQDREQLATLLARFVDDLVRQAQEDAERPDNPGS